MKWLNRKNVKFTVSSNRSANSTRLIIDILRTVDRNLFHLLVSGLDAGNVASNLIGWHSNVRMLTRTHIFDWLNLGKVTRSTFWPNGPTTEFIPRSHKGHVKQQ